MKLPFQIDLSNKVAVVTGGGGVLCSGFAKTLAACGAKVAVCDLRLDAAEAVAEEIRADGGTAIGVCANVLERESLETAKKEITEKLGTCDILINGAGGNNPRGTTTKDYLEPSDLEEKVEGVKTFFDLDPDGVEFVFNLNFLGALIPTQVFALDMAKKPGSVIINISSMNSFRPLTRIPAYSGAKAAVSNFTQWLAVHFAKVGIRVNAIAPGFFITNQNTSLLLNPDGSYTARSEKILAHTPMGKFGTPDDLTGTLLWLCDNDASGFVNGVVVPVDGGFAAYSGV
ncbi:MAG: D-mannonate oxidoreductase [Clostridiales bacterium]|nr:MAG: D-mannonate oxidoreductase [Clostridiales bacterium]